MYWCLVKFWCVSSVCISLLSSVQQHPFLLPVCMMCFSLQLSLLYMCYCQGHFDPVTSYLLYISQCFYFQLQFHLYVSCNNIILSKYSTVSSIDATPRTFPVVHATTKVNAQPRHLMEWAWDEAILMHRDDQC